MSADKRKVSTDALETLGTIIGPDEKRDAIHLAVIPAMAGARLYPGQSITRGADGIAVPDEKGPGIVDPFIPGAVQPEQRFWMVLRPRIITSLRHVWSHPAFEDEPGTHAPKPASKEASEAWLREFCAKSNCPGYDTVMAAIAGESIGEDASAFINGEYFHFDGYDAHDSIPDEFWDHVEVVTGRKMNQRPSSFSCSC